MNALLKNHDAQGLLDYVASHIRRTQLLNILAAVPSKGVTRCQREQLSNQSRANGTNEKLSDHIHPSVPNSAITNRSLFVLTALCELRWLPRRLGGLRPLQSGLQAPLARIRVQTQTPHREMYLRC